MYFKKPGASYPQFQPGEIIRNTDSYWETDTWKRVMLKKRETDGKKQTSYMLAVCYSRKKSSVCWGALQEGNRERKERLVLLNYILIRTDFGYYSEYCAP